LTFTPESRLNEDHHPGGKAMKIDRHGQAKILTTAEIQLLFNEGFTVNPPRDRALFAVCL
jgi:hypothetical protein